jgi:hypothetical protein
MAKRHHPTGGFDMASDGDVCPGAGHHIPIKRQRHSRDIFVNLSKSWSGDTRHPSTERYNADIHSPLMRRSRSTLDIASLAVDDDDDDDDEGERMAGSDGGGQMQSVAIPIENRTICGDEDNVCIPDGSDSDDDGINDRRGVPLMCDVLGCFELGVFGFDTQRLCKGTLGSNASLAAAVVDCSKAFCCADGDGKGLEDKTGSRSAPSECKMDGKLHDILVIMDIDQTMAHSIIMQEEIDDLNDIAPISSSPPPLPRPTSPDDAARKEFSKMIIEGTGRGCRRVSRRLFDFDGKMIKVGNMEIVLRPGIVGMLKALATKFSLGIFSAAIGPYVGLVAAAIDPTSELFGDRIACRDDMLRSSRDGNMHKIIPPWWGWDPSNVIVVDDNATVWDGNPGCSIVQIRQFWGCTEGEGDDEDSCDCIDCLCQDLSLLSSAMISSMEIAKVKADVFHRRLTANAVVTEMCRFDLSGLALMFPDGNGSKIPVAVNGIDTIVSKYFPRTKNGDMEDSVILVV